MTSPPLDAPAAPPAPTIGLRALKLALALAAIVAVAGDHLFYDHALGISLALFLALIATVAVPVAFTAEGDRRGRDLAIALLLLFAGLAPLAENVGPLSITFGVAGLALAVAIVTGGLARGPWATATTAGGMLFTGPFDLPPDAYRVACQAIAEGRTPQWATVLGWLVPVAFCAVFVGLFAAANPLIAGWVSDIPWSALIPGFDLRRILMWFLLLAFTWAFVAPRVGRRSKSAVAVDAGAATEQVRAVSSRLLDSPTILRCLVLFNLLFAVQSATDIAYLWAGLALPPGVTHAAYAHRGAYPLVATALLAAGFVLTALRPGGAGERSPAIRILVCLWIGQNVLLVASAMLRLDFYVQAYGLSVLRLAALIWMALVAVGLASILARIVLRRGNGWLVRVNAMALAAALYMCAFANFGGTVANFNEAHRFAGGQAFDLPYAMSLGADAIPAVDRVLAGYAGPLTEHARRWRWQLALDLRERMQDWRAWTFRSQRLLDYLDAHPEVASSGR